MKQHYQNCSYKGQIIPTVVSNIKDYGVFVKLPMWKIKKSALIPLRHMSDDFVQDPNEHVQVQQTVYAQIIEKSEQEQKITMTSKPSLIQHDQSNLTLALFQDLEKVKKAKSDFDFNYQLGDVVNCIIQEVTEFGLDTLVEGNEGLRGLCPMSGLQDVEIPSKGQKVAGVIGKSNF